jgi:hypothetical protein
METKPPTLEYLKGFVKEGRKVLILVEFELTGAEDKNLCDCRSTRIKKTTLDSFAII